MTSRTSAPISHWRLDLQGVRALAVTLVIVFHLKASLLPGGYIGVDVFFVISGFLITGHIFREVERTGSIKLLAFWGRRIRRLLPAAFLVLIASAVATMIFIPRSSLIQNLTEIGLAGLYVLNWGLATASVDYLAADNVPSIAQHYWSLSVEEQFYIVWPLLMLFIVWATSKLPSLSRLPHVSKRSAIAAALVLVALASFAFSVIETSRSQPSAYFVTTTRAWEFAVGGIIALIPQSTIRSVRLHVAGSWVGAALIVSSAFLLDGTSSFPGWIAVIPVAGTALLVWLGDSESTWGPQYLAKAGPIQHLGNISYSAYLWHWPLIVLFTSTQGRSPGWKWMLLLAATTFLLATLTYRYVENPLKHGHGRWKHTQVTFGFMAAGMAAVCAITFVPVQIIHNEDDRTRIEAQELTQDPTGCFGAYAILNDCDAPYAYVSTVNPRASADDGIPRQAEDPNCSRETVSGYPEVTCNYDRGETMVFLVGDSHADQWIAPVSASTEELGLSLSVRTRHGCLVLQAEASSDSPRTPCAAWSQTVLDEILTSSRPTEVIFSVRATTKHDSTAEAIQTFATLQAAGIKVALVREAPGMEIPAGAKDPLNGPQCVERSESLYDACSWTPADGHDWLSAAAESADVTIMDPRELLCSTDQV